jgi:hypothetical protein
MQNSKNFSDLANLIKEKNLDCKAVIPALEDAINIERMNIDTNRSLDNHVSCLDGEYRIAHTQLLIALLRLYVSR